MKTQRGPTVAVDAVRASAYTVPLEAPEQDGTFDWSSTTMILAEVEGGGLGGLGYSYGHASAASLIRDHLAPEVVGRDAMATSGAWHAMVRSVRNLGRPGIASMAISAVDAALWDLKAKLLGLPLYQLLGPVRERALAYGSGGFTNLTDAQLAAQINHWIELGCRWVKIKVGRDDRRDRERVRRAREALGDRGLMVDANGALSVQGARAQARAFAEHGVIWFEEPVSSDNLGGLAEIVRTAPDGMEIAAGEYGFDAVYFRRMLETEAVHVLQPDATRCGGVTGFLAAEALAQAFDRPLSAHTAPSLHTHLGCACPRVRHVEYFHDHARLERMLFEGAVEVEHGDLVPAPDRPGLGLVFKRADAERFRV